VGLEQENEKEKRRGRTWASRRPSCSTEGNRVSNKSEEKTSRKGVHLGFSSSTTFLLEQTKGYKRGIRKEEQEEMHLSSFQPFSCLLDQTKGQREGPEESK
jgi:hypothetical protein